MLVLGNDANADEASLAGPLLTLCSVAQFLTGHGPVLVCGPGAGDSCMDRGKLRSPRSCTSLHHLRAGKLCFNVELKLPSSSCSYVDPIS